MSIVQFGQAVLDGLLVGGVYALVAAGLTMIFGVMRFINFAHGALLMVGMYTAYWAWTLAGISPYLSLPLTCAVLFVLGALIERALVHPLLDAPEHNQLLLTLGLMLLLENLALFLFSPDFRTVRIESLEGALAVGPFLLNRPRLIAFVGAILVSTALYLLLQRTEVGRRIRATAQDRDGAQLVGINVKRIYVITFGIGAACAGIAGALITPYFYTAPHVGHVFLLMAFVVVVLGGLGNFLGALVGGLMVGVAESVGALLLPGSLKGLIPFALFVLVLFYRPTGLFGGGSHVA